MDIRAEILNRAPTLHSKKVIAILLSGVPVVYLLLGILNTAWTELDSQQLERLRLSVVAIQVLCSSLYLNYHFYRWSKLVAKFHGEISPLIVQAMNQAGSEIATRLLAAESREDVIKIIQSYQKNPNK